MADLDDLDDLLDAVDINDLDKTPLTEKFYREILSVALAKAQVTVDESQTDHEELKKNEEVILRLFGDLLKVDLATKAERDPEFDGRKHPYTNAKIMEKNK